MKHEDGEMSFTMTFYDEDGNVTEEWSKPITDENSLSEAEAQEVVALIDAGMSALDAVKVVKGQCDDGFT